MAPEWSNGTVLITARDETLLKVYSFFLHLFEILIDKQFCFLIIVHELLGIEPIFWRVCGDTSPLEGGRLYHQLSFLKRVWVFKALCDTVAHSHKTVQEAMASEEVPESRQVTLGQDALGFTYLHFPAVSGSDIRVYRQKGWELENDPLWGPIAAERLVLEEERQRELEEKLAKQAAHLKKRKRPSPVKSRKSSSPAKKKQPAKYYISTLKLVITISNHCIVFFNFFRPVNTTPVPQRKKQAPEERPSRIGTRVSPRTLQRQTGLTLYKDTSSESEESEEENEVDPSENEDAQISEQEETLEPETAAAMVKKTPARPKRRARGGGGSRRRSRKKPPAKKKELEKIVEAKEEEDGEASMEVSLQEDKPSTSSDEDKTSPVPDDDEKSSSMVVGEKEKNDLPVLLKEDSNVKEQKSSPHPKEENDQVKFEDVKEEEQVPVKTEPVEQQQDATMSESQPTEENAQPVEETSSKVDEAATQEEKPSTVSSQRFTVSQLVQKLANEPIEDQVKTEPNCETNGEDEPKENADSQAVPVKEEPETSSEEKLFPDIPDPDRSTYDPFFFELIISSVEELQEWIEKFSDDKPGKARPRCEVKLCERFQSLLEEAQPLAADQQHANQKISQQLWKEWESYRCLNVKTKRSAAENAYDSGNSDSEQEQEEEEDSGKSESDDDGIRHSKRLRQRRSRQQESQNEEDEEEEDQPPQNKQRKTSGYGFDPAWDYDPSGAEELQMTSRRRKASFDPEMKNPGYWVGRRMTRATAAFAGSADDFEEGSTSNSPQQQQSTDWQGSSGMKESSSDGMQSDQLAEQLRQLRRQQAQLSSNDPQPAANGSPNIYFATKDEQGNSKKILITNPKAAEMLSQLKRQQLANSSPTRNLAPKMPTSSASASVASPSSTQQTSTPKKILLGLQSPNGGGSTSIDITQLVNQAAQKGLIVSHESRCLTMDLGPHGRFLVTAQLTPNGPRVISATPLPNPTVIANSGQIPLNGDCNTDSGNSTVNRPQPAKMIMTDSRPNNVISPEILRAVAGPDAGEAKLSIVKEGINKVLTLILPGGEMRRLTTSQVQQIQAAVRNKNNKLQTLVPAPAQVPVAAADGSSS